MYINIGNNNNNNDIDMCIYLYTHYIGGDDDVDGSRDHEVQQVYYSA